MKHIYAEGTWCTNCEFFEVPDFAGDDDHCIACGCGREIHADVEVVSQ